MKKKLLCYLPLAAVGIYCTLRYSEECNRGITQGISFCIGVLIPSLFLFMVIAAFAVRSNLAFFLTKPMAGFSRAVFGLPAVSLSAILLALIGGYPIGGRCVGALYEQKLITQKQAQKTAYIAVAAGPGFVVNYIGLALLNSKKTGMILLAAQILAVILTGVIVGKVVPCEETQEPCQAVSSGGNLIIDAVSDASKGAFSMCAMVIVFCAASEVAATVFSPFPEAVKLTSGFLEVTTGVNRTTGYYPLWMTAFYTGFGGLSVHFQIFASLKNVAIKKYLFFLFRIIQGIFAGIFTYILVSIFPETQAVFSTAEVQSAGISGTVWGSAALILSSMVFLGSISQGGKYVLNRGYYNNRL
ncbi:MAG: hypothetical protein IJH32_08240 [Ruminococcus sp.]|nr:hypothetical protein [Ruminococcus sp.]